MKIKEQIEKIIKDNSLFAHENELCISVSDNSVLEDILTLIKQHDSDLLEHIVNKTKLSEEFEDRHTKILNKWCRQIIDKIFSGGGE